MAGVSIKINFYDTEQKDLIKTHFPSDYDLISPIENTFIEVPIEDFQTYSFFKHQTDSDGYRTFLDLAKVARNWGEYYMYFQFDENTGSLTNKYPGRIDGSNVPETLGVAGGLSVASHVHNLTQADWHNIGINRHKDFDFRRLACTVNRYINIEAKGSINDDNSLKSPSVSLHKKSILEKKLDEKFTDKYNYSTDSCLGIITVADKTKPLQSWVVDPIFPNQEMQPRKAKLLKRLNFYYSIIKLISKRSYIAITLANRIKVIEQISDYSSLSGIPLVNSNFDKISLNDSFINSRASNKEKSIIGRSILFNKTDIFFIGIPKIMFDVIINQNIEDIFGLSNKSKTSSQIIDCRIKRTIGVEEILQRNNIIVNKSKKDDNHLAFSVNMTVIENSAGICIARLPLK